MVRQDRRLCRGHSQGKGAYKAGEAAGVPNGITCAGLGAIEVLCEGRWLLTSGEHVTLRVVVKFR